MSQDDGIVKIHGKDYQTVALRISKFRAEHGHEYGISTEVLHHDTEKVVVRAQVLKDGQVMSSGVAEEVRDASKINRTSAMENAETSAVGRALAFLGYAGTEIASAEEVVASQNEMELKEFIRYQVAHMEAIRNLMPSVMAIREALSGFYSEGNSESVRMDCLGMAAESWFELTDDEKQALWKAPTKGGIFTTKELATMKTNEFRDAHFGAQS
jgi:hypothetical protein